MKRFTKGHKGFTLIELLIVIIIIGILAAIAIPMFLSQRNKAKDAGVKEGIHSIQVGLHSYNVDNTDLFPTDAQVAAATTGLNTILASYVDIWPNNQFSGGKMVETTTALAVLGNYSYASAAGAGYGLTGYMSNTKTFSVP